MQHVNRSISPTLISSPGKDGIIAHRLRRESVPLMDRLSRVLIRAVKGRMMHLASRVNLMTSALAATIKWFLFGHPARAARERFRTHQKGRNRKRIVAAVKDQPKLDSGQLVPSFVLSPELRGPARSMSGTLTLENHVQK